MLLEKIQVMMKKKFATWMIQILRLLEKSLQQPNAACAACLGTE